MELTETISIFKRADAPKPAGSLPLSEALKNIQSDEYREKIETVRACLGDKDRYLAAKKKLPALTFPGQFYYRNNKPENLVAATGFIVADLDHIKDVEKTLQLLRQDENIWFAFISVSGEGIKAGLRANGIESDADIKRFYQAIERYFKDVYGITIDPACKDICRLTFVSYDPDLWINPEPYYFDIDAWLKPAKEQAPIKNPPSIHNSTGKEKYARKVLDSCCDNIRQSTPGNQHHTRLRMVRLIGGYIQYIDEGEVITALEAAVRDSGAKDISAAMRTVKDALENGKQNPIILEDRPEPGASSCQQADPPEPEDDKPQILIIDGKLPQMTDQAEEILIDEGKENPEGGIYQRGNQLVRIISADAGDSYGVYRKEQGAKIIHPIDPPYIQDRLTRNVNLYKFDSRKKAWFNKNCPRNIADTLLARVGEWNLPGLRAIIETPIIRPDGTILDKPGYDAKTGFLFIPNYKYEPIRRNPTKEEAEDALAAIIEAIQTFPFNTFADQSVGIAGLMTALIRPSLPTAPVIGFTAPMAGTGKSKFVDGASVLATGKPAAVIGQGANDEETEKRLHSALLQGDRIVCIDNIERALKGQALCQMVTQTIIQARILGQTKKVDIPSTATFFATGNNLTFSGDMLRRALLCRLDPKCERPEERKFDQDFVDLVRSRRNELVNACLTVIRAYYVADTPPQDLTPMGSFEQWSMMVRNPLVWLGLADPYLTREYIREADPAVMNQAALFNAWFEAFGAEAVTVKDAVNKAAGMTNFNDELYESMVNIAGDKTGAVNTRHLGNWLRKHEDQITNDLILMRDGESHRAIRWKIISLSKGGEFTS